MRVIIQRVEKAQVKIGGEIHASIGKGLLIYLGITHDDTEKDIDWLLERIAKLQLFDSDKPLSKSIVEMQYDILVVSQFTLYAGSKKGKRLSFLNSASKDLANTLYRIFIDKLNSREFGIAVKTGDFGAYMDVESINNGPLTLIIDSKSKV